MRTYKYQFEHQSNVIRLGNLLDDMHEVHKYFHLWQRQRYKDGLPYANYNAMSVHLTELKKTTHRHWNSLPSQAIQCEWVCKYFVKNLSWRSPSSGLQTPPTSKGFKQFSETSKSKVNRCGLFSAPAERYVYSPRGV